MRRAVRSVQRASMSQGMLQACLLDWISGDVGGEVGHRDSESCLGVQA